MKSLLTLFVPIRRINFIMNLGKCTLRLNVQHQDRFLLANFYVLLRFVSTGDLHGYFAIEHFLIFLQLYISLQHRNNCLLITMRGANWSWPERRLSFGCSMTSSDGTFFFTTKCCRASTFSKVRNCGISNFSKHVGLRLVSDHHDLPSFF